MALHTQLPIYKVAYDLLDAMLGHSTKAMSDRYIKLEDAQVVEPRTRVL